MRAPSRAVSLPPPVGGWDALSALADMAPDHAVTLDNWYPDADKVSVRRGFQPHVTGFAAAVESLLVYQPASGTRRMFAAAGANIFDATTAGAVGSAVVSGQANARWQSVQMTTTGGHFLIAMNGQNTPLLYDGSTWGTVTFTGPTVANLIWCNLHQRRIWMGESNSLRAWYLGTNAITGTATAFDLTGLASLGGSLIGMGTWTRDGGSGPDDLAAFFTSEGEVLIYSGTDPASASTWGLVGIFRIGKPLGRRSLMRAGAELIVMTEDGFLTLSDVLPVDRVQQSAASISRLINPAVVAASRLYRNNFGWDNLLYPAANMAIFNVPAAGGLFEQYVFNTITKAACRFQSIPARCWALLNENAYFGTGNAVMRFDIGTTDNGAEIRALAVQAPNGFGAQQQKKLFRRAQVILTSEAPPSVGVDMVLDYRGQVVPPPPVASTTPVSLWDVALWDVGTWAGEAIFDDWRGVQGVGRVGSIRVQSASATATPAWIGTNVLYVPGGTL